MFKKCAYCKKLFYKPKYYSKKQWDNRKYCSVKCKNESLKKPYKFAICPTCKKLFNMPNYINKIYCSRKCVRLKCVGWNRGLKGKKHFNWKGGTSNCKSKGGYISIYMPEHPYANNNYILAHRYSAECVLGRFLKSNEVIHHIDENKSNNIPENLYLFEQQRLHYAYHILVKYKHIKQITKSNIIN